MSTVSQHEAKNTVLPGAMFHNAPITLEPGQVTLIASRPGDGKSWKCVEVALEASIRQGKGVVLHSLELDANETLDRVLAIEAKIDISRFRDEDFSDEDWSHISLATASLREAQLDIVDATTVRITDIAESVMKFLPDVVVIDYLQLLTSGDQGEGGAEVRERLLKGLQSIAVGMNVAIVCAVNVPQPGAKTAWTVLDGMGLGAADQAVLLSPR